MFEVGKFDTGEPATWEDGDWNHDGVVDPLDVVAAFQDGGFERGPKESPTPPPNTNRLADLVPGDTNNDGTADSTEDLGPEFVGSVNNYNGGAPVGEMFDFSIFTATFAVDTINFGDGRGGEGFIGKAEPSASMTSMSVSASAGNEPGFSGDHFALRAVAKLVVEKAKFVTFATKNDDGAALRIHHINEALNAVGHPVFWWDLANGAKHEGGGFVGSLDAQWNGELFMTTLLLPGSRPWSSSPVQTISVTEKWGSRVFPPPKAFLPSARRRSRAWPRIYRVIRRNVPSRLRCVPQPK